MNYILVEQEKNQIKLDDKTYTFAEVIELVQTTLDAVKSNSDYCPLTFSPSDVYWLLRNMLSYTNRNVPGEFALRRLEKGTYRVRYQTEEVKKQKATRKLKNDLRKTADYLEKLTGRRPKLK
ncbi:MAG: hypothetical protein OXD54_12160 [Candidatus Poribacteria bacterium]|nr:hypothetical protein [Candidatus Poribacteria bacterium]